MANTGNIQAVVVYKVRAADKVPLDIYDDPIATSGRRQAIAILAGTTNPDPTLYEVQYTYPADGAVQGVPTVELSDDCPAGFITVDKTRIVFQTSDPAENVLLTSSADWALTTAQPFVTVAPTTGPRGENALVITRTATLGQGSIVFTNTETGQTAAIYIINVDTVAWILETGQWDDLGFWIDTSTWNDN